MYTQMVLFSFFFCHEIQHVNHATVHSYRKPTSHNDIPLRLIYVHQLFLMNNFKAVNLLPENKNSALSKLKAIADYRTNVIQNIFAFRRVENIVEK